MPMTDRERAHEERAPLVILTGIERTSEGWDAFRNGVRVGSFRGPGSKARAIRFAGTNAGRS